MTWFVPQVQSTLVDRPASDKLVIQTDGSRSIYAMHDRNDLRFDEPPPMSEGKFIPGTSWIIEVPCEVSGDAVAQLLVLEYSNNAENSRARRVWFSEGTTSAAYQVPSDVTAVSVALRFLGAGVFEIGDLVARPAELLAGLNRTINVEHVDRLKISVPTIVEKEIERSGLVSITLSDSNGNVQMPIYDFPVHPKMGNYVYMETGVAHEVVDNIIEFDVPKQCHTVRVEGQQWKPHNPVHIEGDVQVEFGTSPDALSPMERNLLEIETLPPNDRLIVLYTTAPPVGHPTLSLRPNRLAQEYARQGVRVIFFPFSKIFDNERNPLPGILQFNRDELDMVNEILCKRPGSSNLLIISSYPDVGALTTVDLLKTRGWRTMYEVRDEMEDFNRVGYSKWFDTELERQVVNRVDQVVTVSPRLADKMKIISRSRKSPTVVQNAAPPVLIAKGRPLRTSAMARSRERHRVVGYIGHLTDSWFDWDLVLRTATETPEIEFEIIGHGMPKSIVLPDNVKYLGPQSHDEFIRICQRWKVGLIPLQESPLTYAVDPNKIYEYLAVGLRTVTPPMGAVENCPSTYVYKNPDEFPDSLDRALNTDVTRREIREINRYIETAGWETRARTMLTLAHMGE